MNRLQLLSVTALAAIGVARPAHADNVELRIATLAPSGSPWMEVLDKAAAEIKDKTAGRVTLKYFEGGQQGDERDFVRKIKLGQLDGAAVTVDRPRDDRRVDPRARAADDVRVGRRGRLRRRQDVAATSRRSSRRRASSSTTAARSAGSTSCRRTRSSRSPTSRARSCGCGATTSSSARCSRSSASTACRSACPRSTPALTSGKIDACYGSPVAAVALQWYTKVKYMTSMPMSFAIGATVVSLDSLKKMSRRGSEDASRSIGKANAKKLRKVDPQGERRREGRR